MALFDGRVAIVTGAARGLGRDYARFFAEDGAAVALADVNAEGARQAAKELAASGARALGIECDVTDLRSAEALAERVSGELGRIDILVNNAGIWGDLDMRRGVLDTDPDYWDFVMGVNLKGAWLCTRAVVPAMRAQRRGRIVNMSSIGSRMPAGVYGISKLAMHQLTFSSASEVAADGITVNGVAPGTIYNEATQRQVPKEAFDQLVEGNLIRRAGTSRDMYGAIRWLASDDAEWVTGQTIYVNGGRFSLF
jgi:3-oxoacyl-[acyl-carrier protein] reductase